MCSINVLLYVPVQEYPHKIPMFLLRCSPRTPSAGGDATLRPRQKHKETNEPHKFPAVPHFMSWSLKFNKYTVIQASDSGKRKQDLELYFDRTGTQVLYTSET